MKRKCYITGRRLAINGMIPLMTYKGENIEAKVKRITENNEPISDGAPITYTEKKDGVRPEFDIRTDKWELVQEKMEAGNIQKEYRDWETDRKSTRLNSSHITRSRMPSSA